MNEDKLRLGPKHGEALRCQGSPYATGTHNKWLINQSIASLQYASYQSQYQQINSNSNYVEAFDEVVLLM